MIKQCGNPFHSILSKVAVFFYVFQFEQFIEENKTNTQ